jgi:bacteriocin-like protein
MSDEKQNQNEDPTEELSKEDLEKVQGGAVDAFLYFEREPTPPPPPPKPLK